MIRHYTTNLLRRTFIAAAALALAVPFQGYASQLMKSSSGGGTATPLCDSYSALSVSPNGTLTVVDCVASTTGGGTPPIDPVPAGTFGIATTDSRQTTLLTSGWTNLVWVSRTSGTTGAVSVAVSVSGGCQLGSDHIDWGNGDASTNAVGMNAPAGVSSCTITLGNATNGGVVDTARRSITMALQGSTNNGGNGGTQSCGLTIAPNVTTTSFGFGANSVITMPSGTVAYGALASPITASNGAYESGVVFFESTSTAPPNGTMEISINHCQGAIDTTGGPSGACYYNSGVPTGVNFTMSSAISDAKAASQHICKTDPAQGPWYVNVRYNYPTCPWGQCGYVGQLIYRTF